MTDVVVPPLMMGTTVITGAAVDPVVARVSVDSVDGIEVVSERASVVAVTVGEPVSGVEPVFEGSVESPVEPPEVPEVVLNKVSDDVPVLGGVEKLPEWEKLKDDPRVMVLNVLGKVKMSELSVVLWSSQRFIIHESLSDRPLACTARRLALPSAAPGRISMKPSFLTRMASPPSDGEIKDAPRPTKP